MKGCISKNKAARKHIDSMYDFHKAYAGPSFVHKTTVPAGTFMMNPRLNRVGLNSDNGIWDDVPLNMQLRVLHKNGTTTTDKRLVQNDEPFFVTGEAFVSTTGNVVLVQIIPGDGYPGWVELQKLDQRYTPGSTSDVALDTVSKWFSEAPVNHRRG